MNEEAYAGAWITQMLEAAGTPTVYSEVIPSDAPLPSIRYNVQTRQDVAGVGAGRIFVKLRFLVVVVGEGFEIAPLAPIADSIDEVLHHDVDNPLTLAEAQLVNGITVYSSQRAETFQMTQHGRDRSTYRMIGGLYDVVVQARP